MPRGARWGGRGEGVERRTEPRTPSGTYLVDVTEATRTADGTAGPSVDVAAEGARIAANISRVIEGKPDVVRLALVVLLAEGHLLIEDVPGVGKTTLPRRRAASSTPAGGGFSSPPALCPSTWPAAAASTREPRGSR